MQRTTELLVKLADGDSAVTKELFPLVYDQLRALAGSYFRNERPDHSLQPTALVHEAYIRMIDSAGLESAPRTRVHFQALAARVMRQILVDHARAKGSAKRGGDRTRINLTDMPASGAESAYDFEAIELALVELAGLDARSAQVVELRFFGSLSLEEVADYLGVSLSSVERDWRFARAWLMDRLTWKGPE
jgi:RNA polymerase sigma factor (TIGR02999 family)